jgi:hypothetical protein
VIVAEALIKPSATLRGAEKRLRARSNARTDLEGSADVEAGSHRLRFLGGNAPRFLGAFLVWQRGIISFERPIK